MSKIILFDLGNTLENTKKEVLIPGALKTLQATNTMRDSNGKVPILALVSDFDMPESPAQIAAIQQRYFAILDRLGIRLFFEPVAKRVTLSTEVGVFKPDKKIFQAVLKKLDGHPSFKNVLFITENLDHVQKARLLTMKAIHFKGPGETSGDVNKLVNLIPLIKKFVEAPA